MIQMGAQFRRGLGGAAGQRGRDGDAAARRFRLAAIQRIGGAGRQAQAALHALISQFRDTCGGLFKCHAGHAIIAGPQPTHSVDLRRQ